MAETIFSVGDLVENRYRIQAVVGTGWPANLYQVSDEARDGVTIALKTVRLEGSLEEVHGRAKLFRRIRQRRAASGRRRSHCNRSDVHRR